LGNSMNREGGKQRGIKETQWTYGRLPEDVSALNNLGGGRNEKKTRIDLLENVALAKRNEK